jgi:tetratricopeptide (TPR) repeat protein
MTRALSWTIVAVLAPLVVGAQSASPSKEPLKPRPVTVRMRPSCPTSVTQSGAPTDAQRRDARDMAQRARQSAILGDAAASLSQLRGAAGLDPTEPSIAFELGRAYEGAGANSEAAAEYCRYLALAPTASEAANLRERVATLSPPRADTVNTIASGAFDRAADAYNRGRWLESEANFGTAIKIDSTLAEAYYDRALVRTMLDHRDDAASDFQHYLKLRPDAPDRMGIVARVDLLKAQRLSASQAFGLGVVVPGGGQFYSKRPGRGLLSLAAVGTAVVFAVTEKSTATTKTQTAMDPFGNTYSYSVTTQHKSRPYLVPGFAVAGGVALMSAIDASHYVRNLTGSRSLSLSLASSAQGVGVVASLSLP